MVRFNVLGPVSVGVGEDAAVLPAGIPRTLLVVLLLNANRVVPAEQLATALWGATPPAKAGAGLRNHVLRLRRQLGDEAGARVRTVAPGYLAEASEDEVDTEVFLAGCRRGRRQLAAGDAVAARVTLGEALDLWRGEPLADLPPSVDVTLRVQELHETRITAWEDRITADLQLGRHLELIAELQSLAAAHPLREAVHGQLMLALYRAGRQAEALEAFGLLRRTLVGELAVEPSAPLQDLHAGILAADPALDAPAAAGPIAPGAGPAAGVPYQLPVDTRVFTGRGEELDRLLAIAGQAPFGNAAGMVVISAIEGMAGIGKSALAVHAAHRVRGSFPDGQLFIDLRGHTPGLEPMSAGQALDQLLTSLGVPPQTIPKDLGERAALYRDRLAGTSTLIVLDNAGGTAQIRPLLPNTPGCLVLVTSRRRLAGLDDAHTLTLGTLPEAEAIALLHKAAGPGRIPEQHPGAADLVALCGCVPLAIRVAAAQLRHRRALRIEDLIGQLRDEHSRLEHLHDQERGLEAVFETSYRDLPEAEQRMFRLLGLVPGADFDAYAAANLAAIDLRTAERLLESLLDHNLLAEHTPGRYRFHDLLRLYARSLGAAAPGDPALERLVEYYLHTARATDRHLARRTRSASARSAVLAPLAPDLPDRATALAWIRAERDNLLAARGAAGALSPQAVELTAALAAHLLLEGPWALAGTLHEEAVAAAHQQGDARSEADALCDLARVRMATGDYPGAGEPLNRALTLYQQSGVGAGEANALCDLGRVKHFTGDYAAAADLLERSLKLARDLGDRLGEGNALCELGRGVDFVIEGYSAAADRFEQAMLLYQEIGEGFGLAIALSELGRTRYMAAEFQAAAVALERALAAFQDLGSRHGEASTLGILGRVQYRRGDFAGADRHYAQALPLFQELGHRHGEANILWGMGLVQFRRGDLAGAADRFEAVLTMMQEIGSRHGQANLLCELGRVRHAEGDLVRATELLQQSLAMIEEIGDPGTEADVLVSSAALLAETEGPAEGLAMYRRALGVARGIRGALQEARALEGAARCAAELGEHATALEQLQQAVGLYQRMGAAEVAPAARLLAEWSARAGRVD